MRRTVWAAVLPLVLAACASPYFGAKHGNMSGSVVTVWVGADNFLFVPGRPDQAFAFETATTKRLIEPGLMYTDGGSIPRIAQVFPGFSPWGYGPAYIIHDWIFYGRHCALDRGAINQSEYADDVRFADVNGDPTKPPNHPRHNAVSFDESALILAEAIKTLIDQGNVPPRPLPAELISAAVDSPIALGLWNAAGRCESNHVNPRHIAIAWLRILPPGTKSPPLSWKLSPWEIERARAYLPEADRFIKSLEGQRPTQKPIAPQAMLAQ
jgi:hypothetical protein